MRGRWFQVTIGCALFVFALALRLHFFCGFVLGDDLLEFTTLRAIASSGPNLSDQLQVRFAGWLLTLVSVKLFGLTEVAFFLPTWVVSASFAVIAYALLLGCGYGLAQASLAGLFVASAPFEVLMGSLRANDLFLAWMVALGMLVLLSCEQRPVLQGVLLALCFWFGFYVKLWAVYLLPPLAVYYLYRRAWAGAASFVAASLLFHGATLLFWKAKLGHYFPFIATHAATYPIPLKDLPRLFLDYPRLLFVGSDLGSTLFGAVPCLLVGLLLAKVLARWLPASLHARGGRDFARWDRLDVLLIITYGVFFALLEFFPNAFHFDRYYSAPRIFRYLTPLSLAMTLHVAKMAIDVTAIAAHRRVILLLALFVGLITINLMQAAHATQPARSYRRVLFAMRDEIRREAPPVVVAEYWLAGWLQGLYLNDEQDRTTVMTAYNTYPARAYEAWLDKNQARLPAGTMLITGFGGYPFYGAHRDGFQLRLFGQPLSAQWTLVKDYGPISHLPTEPARLWRLSRSDPRPQPTSDPPLPVEGDTASAIFTNGMRHFDAGHYPTARAHFKAVIDRFPNGAEDARYFYAVTFFREQRWDDSRAAFVELIRTTPSGRWVAAAHYHIGRCHLEQRRADEARNAFRYVIENFPHDANTRAMAEEGMRALPGANRGLVTSLLSSLREKIRR